MGSYFNGVWWEDDNTISSYDSTMCTNGKISFINSQDYTDYIGKLNSVIGELGLDEKPKISPKLKKLQDIEEME